MPVPPGKARIERRIRRHPNRLLEIAPGPH
jgi:hypothetical protein